MDTTWGMDTTIANLHVIYRYCHVMCAHQKPERFPPPTMLPRYIKYNIKLEVIVLH